MRILVIAALVLAAVMPAHAQPPAALTVFTDETLVARMKQVQDINNIVSGFGRRDALGLYRGYPLVPVVGGLGQTWTFGYDLPRGVTCASVGGVAQVYDGGDLVARPYTACIPKVLVDNKLDRGWVILGPEFTDDSLTAFAVDFFRHAEAYRKLPPQQIQGKVAGTYKGWRVTTQVACDVVGSAAPQCLQEAAPLLVSLEGDYRKNGDKLDCERDGGARIRYDVPNEYKALHPEPCVPKVLVDSGVWRQGLAPGGKAEVLASTPSAATDTLTDAQLLDYAAKLFKGDPSISPPKNEEAIRLVGVHHGVEVWAAGVPCINCDIQLVAVYYKIPGDDRACRKNGGESVLYVVDVRTVAGRLSPFCVPGIVARAGLVGAGKPDDGRGNGVMGR